MDHTKNYICTTCIPPVGSAVVPEIIASAPRSSFCVMADTLNLYVVAGVS